MNTQAKSPTTVWIIGCGFALFLFPLQLPSQQLSPQQLFHNNCGPCHGDDAHGTGQGPALAGNPHVAGQTAAQLHAFLEKGSIAAGMPSFADLPQADLTALTGFLRSINTGTVAAPAAQAEPARKITWVRREAWRLAQLQRQ